MVGVPAAGRAARLLMSLLRVGTPEFWSIYEYLGIKSFGLWSQMGVWSQMGIIEEPRSVGTCSVLVVRNLFRKFYFRIIIGPRLRRLAGDVFVVPRFSNAVASIGATFKQTRTGE